MKIDITLTREDLDSRNSYKAFDEIERNDFPSLSRELIQKATNIVFIDTLGISKQKVLKERSEREKYEDTTKVVKSFIEDWVKRYGEWEQIEYDSPEYQDILNKTQDMDALSTTNSMHIYEQQFLIDGKTYRVLSAIGSDANPSIEIKIG